MPSTYVDRNIRTNSARLSFSNVRLRHFNNGKAVDGLSHAGPPVEYDGVVLGSPGLHSAQDILNVLSDLIGGFQLEQLEISK